jgi:hypothetical protein
MIANNAAYFGSNEFLERGDIILTQSDRMRFFIFGWQPPTK